MMPSRLILLSACFYSATFIYPSWFAELQFIALAPIFITRPTWRYGFLWGAYCYMILFAAILDILLHHGATSWCGIGYFFLVLYGAIITMFWFIFAEIVSRKTSILTAWIFSTWLIWLFNDYAFFWIFGQIEGNRLLNPLVPLAIRPAWLWALAYVPQEILLLMLVITNMMLAQIFWYKRYNCSSFDTRRRQGYAGLRKIYNVPITPSSSLEHIEGSGRADNFYDARASYAEQASKGRILCLLLLTGFWSFGWFMPAPENSQAQALQTICATVCYNNDALSSWQKGILLAELSRDLLKHHPHVRYILMPESIMSCCLEHQHYLLRCWRDILPEKAKILLGAYRCQNEKFYNTLYYVEDCRIVKTYDKTHLVFFTERVPEFYTYLPPIFSPKTLFHGSDSRAQLPGTPFVPYLCSEFFFRRSLVGTKDDTILCLANDSWFSGTYPPRLMYLYARFQAVCSHLSIMYVAYKYQALIDARGKIYPLLSC
jgi:hypothetical protein